MKLIQSIKEKLTQQKLRKQFIRQRMMGQRLQEEIDQINNHERQHYAGRVSMTTDLFSTNRGKL